METVPMSELERLSQPIRGLAVMHDLLTFQTKEGGEAEYLSAQSTLDKLFPILQGITRGRNLTLQIEDALALVAAFNGLTVRENPCYYPRKRQMRDSASRSR